MVLDMRDMERLYASQLGEMRDAERRVVEAMPTLRAAATAESLRVVLAGQEASARARLDRVDRLLEGLGVRDGSPCRAMEGMVDEVGRVIESEGDPRVRDVAIICTVQKMEHFEIAVYGCLRAWAGTMGRTEESELLRESLREGWDGDDLLSRIAEAWINGVAIGVADGRL